MENSEGRLCTLVTEAILKNIYRMTVVRLNIALSCGRLFLAKSTQPVSSYPAKKPLRFIHTERLRHFTMKLTGGTFDLF